MYTSVELARELMRLALGITSRIQYIYCCISCKPGFLLLDDIKSSYKVITRRASSVINEIEEARSYDSVKLYIFNRA